MAKPKKTSTKAKPSVKVQDLKTRDNPKGGGISFSKHEFEYSKQGKQ